ncbi:hypothetical protein EIN_186430 [Entamoeba invadens IP1]|uniref:hypothetical protein n=1 Tax=Entamoeba invadens IP1 TaxID=370355 RepID=UPI0002C3ED56|nr:hypothetical protein EIN_186430 [Entamoeba invadens IP1]ELP94216.1 hypothetical protein EIN_186430 [Entamoeba invadens IP1]|eukprot:XP_004260987.1 hypothetical protein EIN_186430 [Entamoeba invadens IP1]
MDELSRRCQDNSQYIRNPTIFECISMSATHTFSLKAPAKTSEEENTAFKQFRDSMAHQQGVFILLLCQYCKIELGQPSKKSVLTKPSFNVVRVDFGNDEIDVSHCVKERCLSILMQDKIHGIKETTAKRRRTANRMTETHHLLMDLLMEKGYFCEITQTTGKNGTRKTDLVRRIFYNGGFLFSKKQINTIGDEANLFLSSLFDGTPGKTVTIEHNDPRFLGILNCEHSKKHTNSASKRMKL